MRRFKEIVGRMEDLLPKRHDVSVRVYPNAATVSVGLPPEWMCEDIPDRKSTEVFPIILTQIADGPVEALEIIADDLAAAYLRFYTNHPKEGGP